MKLKAIGLLAAIMMLAVPAFAADSGDGDCPGGYCRNPKSGQQYCYGGCYYGNSDDGNYDGGCYGRGCRQN